MTMEDLSDWPVKVGALRAKIKDLLRLTGTFTGVYNYNPALVNPMQRSFSTFDL